MDEKNELEDLDSSVEGTVVEPTVNRDRLPTSSGSDAEDPGAAKKGGVAEEHVDEDPQDLKFTGYTPPEKKGIGPFLKQHKVGAAIGLGLSVVVVSVSVLLLASSDDDIPITQQVRDVVAASDSAKDDEPEEVQSEPEVVRISDAQFSINNNGQFYGLETLDGERWLDRSQFDWETFLEWEGWLFYTADRSGDSTDSQSIGVEVFNYDTQEHASIAEVQLFESARTVEPMYIENNYAYLRVESRKSTEAGERKDATYRCKLDASMGCVNFEEFYDGRGRVYIFSDELQYIVSNSGEGGLVTTIVSTYDTQSKELTKVIETKTSLSVGMNFERVDAEGFVWFTETEGDPASPSISRILAVDPEGETAFVIPANAVPVAGALPVRSVEVEYNQILYANDSQEVIFNTDTKQFEAPRERLLADEAQKQETLLDAEVRLNVPKEYLMRTSN